MKKSDERQDAMADNNPAPDMAEAISLEQQREFRRMMRIRHSQIPSHFLQKTLANFETRGSDSRKQMVQMAREYIKTFGNAGEPRPGAIFHGGTGSGKTHFLCAILMELMERRHDVLFYGVPDLFKDIRGTFDKQADMDEDQLLEQVANVEVLALDDLGAEKTSDWVLDRLYWIVNERYCNVRPTLITTNHDWPDDLEKAVGKRITSRLAEMCRVIGPFPAEDWRMKSAGLKRRLT